ncbi:polycystin-2-like [Drosophila busckii]|uniref:polycystin-2-like n=1 Tax=Drosophila busckii TaxID=30019 RepID=UPI00083EC211|nr:polycystin-2-like [Drosophila busckii]
MNQFKRSHANYGNIHYTTEVGTKMALRHVATFCVYLIAVTIVGYSMTPKEKFFYNTGMKKIFERELRIPEIVSPRFSRVRTIRDCWIYLEQRVLPALHDYRFSSYDNKWLPQINTNTTGILYSDNLLLGAPRLRQVRVRKNTCNYNTAFLRYFNDCVGAYRPRFEDTTADYKDTPYKTIDELDATAIYGEINTYDTGGYVQQLTYNYEKNVIIINELRNKTWIDRASRLLLLEFNLINVNKELLMNVRQIFEIMPGGLVVTKYESLTTFFDPLFVKRGYAISICVILMYGLNMYYTYFEIKKIFINGFTHHMTNTGFWLCTPRITLIYALLCYNIWSYVAVTQKKEELKALSEDFISIDKLIYINQTYRCCLGFILFLSWISLLLFMDFNPVLRTIGLAMSKAAKDLAAFIVMFVILFIAYGELGLLLFGSDVKDFKDFSTAVLTMVRMIGGDFDYFKLETDHQILGPIFFLSYLFIMFYIILNMFLAAIVLAYRTATKTVIYKPNFLWYVIKKILFRLTFGLVAAPTYPRLRADMQFDEHNLKQLHLLHEYTEAEEDMEILCTRLNLIEETFRGFTNTLTDLIADAKKRNRKHKRK